MITPRIKEFLETIIAAAESSEQANLGEQGKSHDEHVATTADHLTKAIAIQNKLTDEEWQTLNKLDIAMITFFVALEQVADRLKEQINGKN